MLVTHARVETTLTLRHGEQVLLTLLIPIALLVGLSMLNVLPADDLVAADGSAVSKVDWITPRILALAVMSSAFTGQAIALGFDRRYGVLKRLSATALPRWLLVAGRVIAALLGWTPTASGALMAIALVVVGTISFGSLGVLLGGSLRAEAVLALANIVWF
ncbi:MAG: multidrug ABC transporter permease, partial [Haloechinothrix sp.]